MKYEKENYLNKINEFDAISTVIEEAKQYITNYNEYN